MPEVQTDPPTEIRYLTHEHILLIHERVLIVTNGVPEDPTVLNPNLVASVAIAPQTAYFSEEQYPGLFVKAAVLLKSLAGAQLFVTGNKRTGWEVVRVFLGWNGYRIAMVTSKDEHESRNESIGRLLDRIGGQEVTDACEIASVLELYFQPGIPAKGRYRHT
jgi:death-on-curing protein